MSVRQVHPRGTFQKQFRTRPLRQQNATFISVRTAVLCRGSVQRYTLFREIPCIADRKLPFCHDSVQRHTISRGKACIATAGYRKSRSTMQRHTLFREIPCVAKGKPQTAPNTKKTTAAPQKKSARIGNDRCRHFHIRDVKTSYFITVSLAR